MFDFETIDNLESYEEKLNYATQNLELFETGSTRNIFVLDSSRLLKVARNEEGLIANNVESYYSRFEWDLLTKVLDYDSDFFWITSERYSKIDEAKFLELSSIEIDNLYLHLYLNRFSKTIQRNDVPLIESDSIIFFQNKFDESNKIKISKEIIQKSEEIEFDTSDISRIENFGIVVRGGQEKLAIVNYEGFSDRFRKFW